MRIALIATADRAGGDGARPAMIAGKSIARHQLDFALALRCEKIVCLGNGATPEAIALQHAAEAGGARFQTARGVRDLPAAVRGDDQLLVLAHGLLPESSRGFTLLKEGNAVLVLPAEAGWAAGFERLDLTASWGGAMMIPGRLADKLDQLPDDAEPIAGLLRIARQDGVPERPLGESELSEGRWQIVRSRETAQALEPGWLRRRLPSPSPFRPTAWLATLVLRQFGSPLIGGRRAFALLSAASVMLVVGAIVAGWFGLSWAGFIALAFAALTNDAADGLNLLRRSIFTQETRFSRTTFILRVIWDLTLVAIGVLSIDATRAERLFPPLVTAGLLWMAPPWPTSGWRALAGDRGALAVILATAASFGVSEGTFMTIALVLILLRVAPAAEQRG